ncbi:MAG: peptidoglycan-binding domain-containing protein [Saprospiraceae bacterium]
MYRLLYLIIILFSSGLIFAQPPNAEPGKCYAKGADKPQEESKPFMKEVAYSVYVGENDVPTKTIYHTTHIGSDGSILERIPVEVPKKKGKIPAEDLAEVLYETHYDAQNGNAGGFVKWHEIVCSDKVNPRLILEIADQLSYAGFIANGPHETFDIALKKALVDFQRANNLNPVGHLDFKTLDALGLDPGLYK